MVHKKNSIISNGVSWWAMRFCQYDHFFTGRNRFGSLVVFHGQENRLELQKSRQDG